MNMATASSSTTVGMANNEAYEYKCNRLVTPMAVFGKLQTAVQLALSLLVAVFDPP